MVIHVIIITVWQVLLQFLSKSGQVIYCKYIVIVGKSIAITLQQVSIQHMTVFRGMILVTYY